MTEFEKAALRWSAAAQRRRRAERANSAVARRDHTSAAIERRIKEELQLAASTLVITGPDRRKAA
jgi:hypothetical protein